MICLVCHPYYKKRCTSDADETVRKLWCQIIIFLVSTCVYWNSLNGDFVHDDIVAIVRNPDVTFPKSFQSSVSESGQKWWSFLQNDFWGSPMSSTHSHKSYRPLTTFTFRVNFLMCGDSLCPAVFHASNILIHAAVSCLLLYVCRTVLKLKFSTCLLTAGIFAVHPVHTEAVAGITGRADTLAALLMLCSFFLYHKSLQKFNMLKSKQAFHEDKNHNQCNFSVSAYEKIYSKNSLFLYTTDGQLRNHSDFACAWLLFAGASAISVVSMLAKETGATVMGIIVLLEFFVIPGIIFRKRRLAIVCALAVVGLLMRLSLMHGTLPQFGRADNPAAYSDSVLTRFLTFCYLPVFNAKLLLYPAQLCYDWQMGSIPLVESLYDTRNLQSCAFYSLVFTLVYKTMLSQSKHKNALAAGLLFLVLPFLPASNLLFPVGFVAAERVLYAPSIGFCIIIAVGVERLGKVLNRLSRHHQTLSSFLNFGKRVSVALLISTYAIRTWNRNLVWQSRESLFASGIRDNPLNAKVHFNYANLQKDLGNVEKAREHYSIAIELWPEYASAHNNLGTLLMEKPDLAEYHFLKAIQLSSGEHAGAHYNLGFLYMKQGKFCQSCSYFHKLLDLDPSHRETFNFLKVCNKQTSSDISSC